MYFSVTLCVCVYVCVRVWVCVCVCECVRLCVFVCLCFSNVESRIDDEWCDKMRGTTFENENEKREMINEN